MALVACRQNCRTRGSKHLLAKANLIYTFALNLEKKTQNNGFTKKKSFPSGMNLASGDVQENTTYPANGNGA